MKDYNKNESPVKEENFVWIAQYNSEDKWKRTFLPEFEFKNGGMGNVCHMFDEIEDDKLSYLGYMGNGYKFFMDVNNGLFNVYNTEFKVTYFDLVGNKEYDFMNENNGPFINKNKILYKIKAMDLEMGIDNKEVNIDKKSQNIITIEYGFGFKKKIGDFNIEAVFHIPMEKEEKTEENPNPVNKPTFFTFKITSPYNIHGELRLYFNNKIVCELAGDLVRDHAKIFKATIN